MYSHKKSNKRRTIKHNFHNVYKFIQTINRQLENIFQTLKFKFIKNSQLKTFFKLNFHRRREQERDCARVRGAPVHPREVEDRDLHRAYQRPEVSQHHFPDSGPRPILQEQPRTLPWTSHWTRR